MKLVMIWATPGHFEGVTVSQKFILGDPFHTFLRTIEDLRFIFSYIFSVRPRFYMEITAQNGRR